MSGPVVSAFRLSSQTAWMSPAESTARSPLTWKFVVTSLTRTFPGNARPPFVDFEK
jgi:hypothetical protein